MIGMWKQSSSIEVHYKQILVQSNQYEHFIHRRRRVQERRKILKYNCYANRQLQ